LQKGGPHPMGPGCEQKCRRSGDRKSHRISRNHQENDVNITACTVRHLQSRFVKEKMASHGSAMHRSNKLTARRLCMVGCLVGCFSLQSGNCETVKPQKPGEKSWKPHPRSVRPFGDPLGVGALIFVRCPPSFHVGPVNKLFIGGYSTQMQRRPDRESRISSRLQSSHQSPMPDVIVNWQR
jgi:hypothetical protein